jgi:hypothetical protein
VPDRQRADAFPPEAVFISEHKLKVTAPYIRYFCFIWNSILFHLPGDRVDGAKGMPINRLLSDSKLSPEQIEVLNAAFNRALRELHLVDRNDPVCEIVARKIIEIGQGGLLDPEAIADATVKQLGPPG